MEENKINSNYQSIHAFLCGYLYNKFSSYKVVNEKINPNNINEILQINWKNNKIPIFALKHYTDIKIIDNALGEKYWKQYMIMLLERKLIDTKVHKYNVKSIINKDAFYAIMLPIIKEKSGKNLVKKVQKYQIIKLFKDLHCFLRNYKSYYINENILIIYGELYANQIKNKKRIKYTLNTDNFLKFLNLVNVV